MSQDEVKVGDQVRVVRDAGPDRPYRKIDGIVEAVDEFAITVRSGTLLLTIGRRFIVSIERWVDARRQGTEEERQAAFDKQVGEARRELP